MQFDIRREIIIIDTLIKFQAMKRLILSILFTALVKVTFGQQAIVIPKSSTIKTTKGADDLTILIELDFVNNQNSSYTANIQMILNNSQGTAINQFNPIDFQKVKIVNDSQQIALGAGEVKKAPKSFFVFIDKSVVLKTEKLLLLQIKDSGNEIGAIKVSIQPEEKVYALSEYLDDCQVKLDYVTKVESTDNLLTVQGYKLVTDNGAKESVFLKRKVLLKERKTLLISEWRLTPSFSLTTIPYKIRPEITEKGVKFAKNATTGLSNIGFNIDYYRYLRDYYFATGKKSSHKFATGFWLAPSVEELDSASTNGYLAKDKKSKQLFVSMGFSFSYSYNDISLIFVPFGWDLKTSTIGDYWVYDGRRWIGFGIGISPKLFSSILNK